jgi:hypothetical protein
MSGLVMSTAALTRPKAAENPDCDARASELLAQIMAGKLSVQAAGQHWRMRQPDAEDWLRDFHRSTLLAFDEQLRQALIQQGATPEALCGPELSISLSDISIVDWLQAIQLFAKHALITVRHDAGESRLWCSNGSLIDAESGQLRGEAAVFRIVGIEQGQVVTELRAVRRERTIRTSTQGLLLEAARRKDEAALLRHRLGNLERRFQAATVTLNRSLNTVETATLRVFTEPLRLAAVLEQSELGDIETLAALESLIRAGLLVEASPTTEPERNLPPPEEEMSKRGAAPVLPISFTLPRERQRREWHVRWLASTSLMALVVSAAAWFGAGGSLERRSTIPFQRPPVAAAPPALSPATEREETYQVVMVASPPEARVQIDGRDVGAGYWSARLPRDGAQHEIRISAAGFVPARILFVDTAPLSDVRLEPLPSPPLEPGGDGAERPSPRDDGASPAASPTADRVVKPRPRPSLAARRTAPPSAPQQGAAGPGPRKKKPRVQIIDVEMANAEGK